MRGFVGARPNPDISWQDHWVAPDAILERRRRKRRPEEESKRGEESATARTKVIEFILTKQKCQFLAEEKGERSKVKY